MKNKKKTYLLLALVVGVWGTIAYKIIAGINPNIPEMEAKQNLAVREFKLDTKIDTFSVKAVDRDPFLGTTTKKKSLKKSTNSSAKTKTWIPISYLGTIKNNNQKQQVFIVAINGKQQLLKKGNTSDSITLVNGNNDRVILRYKNQQRTFARKGRS